MSHSHPIQEARYSILRCLPIIVATVIAGVWVEPASACLPVLRGAKTQYLSGADGDLCRLSDRYQAARTALFARGYSEPDRISDVLAPRFINLPGWLSARKKGISSPWKVYRPAPTSWGNWEKGREYIDSLAIQNQSAGKAEPLTLPRLLKLHSLAMGDDSLIGGRLREYSEIGKQYLDTDAITRAEVETVNARDYMTPMEPGVRLVKWVPTECQTKKQMSKPHAPKPPRIPRDLFFKDADGVERQCGFYYYSTEVRDVPRALSVWMDRAEDEMESWARAPAESDLVARVAKLQRWFVAIHPFRDGNGRMSRYTLDYYLRSFNLPTPILSDQDQDLTLREGAWSAEVAKGMLRHIVILENCLRGSGQEPVRKGCNQVSHEAPFTFFWEK